MSGSFEPPDSHRLQLHGPAVGLGDPVPAATCPACRQAGAMRVTPFIWQGARQLQWCCEACRTMWVSPERRQNR